jgi:hypothetical protein
MNSIITNTLNAVELVTCKKMSVNFDMLHSDVSIISVLLATVTHCKNNNIDYTVKSIISEIRKNREVSTIVLHADNVVFNPLLTVTGTNCRLFPVYYVQKIVDCLPTFVNPDAVVAVVPDVVVPVVDAVVAVVDVPVVKTTTKKTTTKKTASK